MLKLCGLCISAEGEKFFTSCRGWISKIQNELIDKKQKKPTLIKKCAKDTSQKKKYKWPIGTWKSAHYEWLSRKCKPQPQ
jgi:hypothetical protein